MSDRWETAATQCAEMARALLAQDDVQAVLDAIVQWCVHIVDGCEDAGINLARKGGRIATAAAHGEVARISDRLQNEHLEGPCFDALWQEDTFTTADLGSEPRGPVYAPAAASGGIRSVLAFRLTSSGQDTLGALNLFSSRGGAFDETDRAIGLVVAAHAGVALRWAQVEGNLKEAVEGHRVIGPAIGVLVERERLTPEEAFARLSRISQNRNLRLRDLAERIIFSGEIPDADAR